MPFYLPEDDAVAKLEVFGNGTALNQSCNIFAIPNGYLQISPSKEQLGLTQPCFYLNNCADYLTSEVAYYPVYQFLSANNFLSIAKDGIGVGNVALSYVISSVTVAAWMLVLVLILSRNHKPFTCKFCALVYGITMTVVLARSTAVFRKQHGLGIQDTRKFYKTVLGGLSYNITMILSEFFTWIAWVDILRRIYPTHFRRPVYYSGTVIVGIWLLISSLDRFYYSSRHETRNQSFISIVSAVLSGVIYSIFSIMMLVYLFHFKGHIIARNKSKLAAQLCLNVADIGITVTFFIMYRTSTNLDAWSSFVYTFTQVLSVALIWELCYDIERLERTDEHMAVIGRQVDDSLPEGDITATQDLPKAHKFRPWVSFLDRFFPLKEHHRIMIEYEQQVQHSGTATYPPSSSSQFELQDLGHCLDDNSQVQSQVASDQVIAEFPEAASYSHSQGGSYTQFSNDESFSRQSGWSGVRPALSSLRDHIFNNYKK
ncbi:hypothetical protein PP7435_CHR4-0065 [Komagataella phaffii CBS 7435]|uniref:PH-response regulator protein n=2 Tax=Komagataella phaffii TaxID=460519 RepID=C4R983_KOMPG|nr:pH-response regulator protein [Komagataella phaffii GS115]AOA65311.1 GQ67_05350T0 [Komagataella phaffii]CAH2450377.1 hypothetical protein BQ9382_C4-0060 [Komagataella phaffii CBS 7435]AOA70037.1 GQ68_05263T0 [Komagataella phaffii GS115]CAY72158.1 pH-response regulator protein [Komagataella phaffii GS115]CCA40243.1 hypothetical protein PP7435_CHR4-0065 [Komagataella phaffii CBS 7435]